MVQKIWYEVMIIQFSYPFCVYIMYIIFLTYDLEVFHHCRICQH